MASLQARAQPVSAPRRSDGEDSVSQRTDDSSLSLDPGVGSPPLMKIFPTVHITIRKPIQPSLFALLLPLLGSLPFAVRGQYVAGNSRLPSALLAHWSRAKLVYGRCQEQDAAQHDLYTMCVEGSIKRLRVWPQPRRR